MSTVATEIPLMVIPDDEFRDLVAEALKVGNQDYQGPLNQEVVDALRSPDVVDRTHLVLVAMKKNVEGQLAAKRADYIRKRTGLQGHELRDAEREYQSWRAGALRFKSGVEEFMVGTRGKSDDYHFAYETLRSAILLHRATVEAALENDEDTNADEVLWKLVEPHS